VLCGAAGDPRWDHIQVIGVVPEDDLEAIKHFFEVYKDLEPGKLSEVSGFEGREAAWREIQASRDRLRAH
jgi:inorganic pyrophosphatase